MIKSFGQMTVKDINTEKRILLAAKKVFQEKGHEGARMQEIADEAEINKALLHYYFRTKDKLFDAVFIDAFFKLIPNVTEVLDADLPLFDKIKLFVSKYMDVFIEHPFIPGFVIHELNRNPQKIVSLISGTGINPMGFITQVVKAQEEGVIRQIDPRQLVVNILALCVFPFVARPIVSNIVFGGDQIGYDRFLEERKSEVAEFIIKSIKI